MNEIEKTGLVLREKGYQFQKTKIEEIGIYYKMEEATAVVVANAICSERFILDRNSMEHLAQRLTEMFCSDNPGENPLFNERNKIGKVEVLFLVMSKEGWKLSHLATSSVAVWIYDMTAGRMLIYEKQPGEFHGLREVLEHGIVLETGQRNTEKKSLFYREDGSKRAVMNTALVAINIGIWILMELFGDTTSGSYIAAHGGLYWPFVLEDGKWYLLITSMFIHFGITHLSNNMLVLFFTGSRVEDAVGKICYLIIYLGAGIGGGLLSLFMMVEKQELTVSAGASGAIFGIVGALLWIVIANHGRFEKLNTRGVIFMIALCLYYGFSSMNVDNWGHLGGLVTGFLLCMILYRKKTGDKKGFRSGYR